MISFEYFALAIRQMISSEYFALASPTSENGLQQMDDLFSGMLL